MLDVKRIYLHRNKVSENNEMCLIGSCIWWALFRV